MKTQLSSEMDSVVELTSLHIDQSFRERMKKRSQPHWPSKMLPQVRVCIVEDRIEEFVGQAREDAKGTLKLRRGERAVSCK